jgi:hypothetical protein
MNGPKFRLKIALDQVTNRALDGEFKENPDCWLRIRGIADVSGERLGARTKFNRSARRQAQSG